MRSRAEVVSNRLQIAYPDTNRNRRFTMAPLGEGRGLRAATRPLLQLLAGTVLMVLLVACVNVATYCFRGPCRVKGKSQCAWRLERLAGALVRQWLTESALLGGLGSIGALLMAGLSAPLLHAFVIPDSIDLSVNPRVFGFTLAVGVGSGLIFGLAPVLHAVRRSTHASLRSEGGTIAGGARAAGLRGALVVVQIAVSFVLLVGAGLFVRTLANAYSVEVQYPIDQTLVANLNLEPRGYFEGGSRGPEAGLAVYEQTLSRVEALPGVVAVAAARMTVRRPADAARHCRQHRPRDPVVAT